MEKKKIEELCELHLEIVGRSSAPENDRYRTADNILQCIERGAADPLACQQFIKYMLSDFEYKDFTKKMMLINRTARYAVKMWPHVLGQAKVEQPSEKLRFNSVWDATGSSGLSADERKLFHLLQLLRARSRHFGGDVLY